MMMRILLLLLFLIIVGVAVVAGYAFFGDLSPPEGSVVIAVEIDNN